MIWPYSLLPPKQRTAPERSGAVFNFCGAAPFRHGLGSAGMAICGRLLPLPALGARCALREAAKVVVTPAAPSCARRTISHPESDPQPAHAAQEQRRQPERDNHTERSRSGVPGAQPRRARKPLHAPRLGPDAKAGPEPRSGRGIGFPA